MWKPELIENWGIYGDSKQLGGILWFLSVMCVALDSRL